MPTLAGSRSPAGSLLRSRATRRAVDPPPLHPPFLGPPDRTPIDPLASHFLTPQVMAPLLRHFPRPPLCRAALLSQPLATIHECAPPADSPSRDLHLGEVQLRETSLSRLGRKDARHRRPHSGDARSRETLNRIRRTTPSLTVAPAWLLITGNPPSVGPSPPRSVRSPWPRPQSRAWPGNRKKGSARTTWTEPRPRQAATTAPRWARLRSQQAA
jgi:hypothetical protein